MSGYTEKRTSGASGGPNGKEAVLTWEAARSMLPLVQRIINDVVENQNRLTLMQNEKARLDRQRRELAWPERSRRYVLREEIADTEQRLHDTYAELESLGVVLVDPEIGQVGFPTIINKRRAYFSWRPSEETLGYWHYPDEEQRQTIPLSWTKLTDVCRQR